MLYVAMPFALADGAPAIARLAMPLLAIDRAMDKLHLALILATVLSLLVAVLMSSIAAHLAARSLRLLTTIATRGRAEISVRAPSPARTKMMSWRPWGVGWIAWPRPWPPRWWCVATLSPCLA